MEDIIVRHCAPTLAGLKTANLVNCPKGEELTGLFGNREKLRKKGIEVAILSENTDSALVYVYRKNKLKNDLKNPEAIAVLKSFGYMNSDVSGCIEHLKERIKENPCFPHEIGVFLGYPPQDVKGFIEHKGQNFKCMGYWKVYCNECEAKKTFAKYKKCIDVYTKVYLEGTTLDRLTVAV